MESYSTRPFVTGFFHSASCFLRFIHVVSGLPSVLMAEYYIVVGLDHILFIHHLLTDMWVVSTFLAVVNMLLWTFVFNYLLEHLFSVLRVYISSLFLKFIFLYKCLLKGLIIFMFLLTFNFFLLIVEIWKPQSCPKKKITKKLLEIISHNHD